MRTSPALYGGLSYRPPGKNSRKRPKRFNTAIATSPDGTVLGVYHKKALMPFGEYIPFADRFPWLKDLSPQTGDFSVGDISEPIIFPLQNSSVEKVSIASLICYEDLIPKLARDAANRGAELLVNLTNDAWYGDTAAPHQHHLLALWRSIETGRAMLRVTNTSLTGVVDPLGNTTETLPVFEPGIIVTDVPLMSHQTLYSRIGDLPVWILAISVFIGALIPNKTN